MRRWLERLSTLAIFSLLVHLCVVAAMKLFVPPPPAFATQSETIDSAPLVVLKVEQKAPLPPEQPHPDQFGEKTGEGDSVASLDLPGQMQSETPHDFEQAWLRQQPNLSAEVEREQSSKKAATLVPSGIQAELPALSPNQIGKGDSLVEATVSDKPVEERASDGFATSGNEGDDQKINEQRQANAAQPEPAPQGETDADAFAKVEGVSLVGGVKARQGREIRFSRPRVDLAFRAEFTRLQKRRMGVLFRVTTDDSGRPRNVAIVRSSGSEQIDQSLRLALFDSWFGGKMPDDFDFEVRFYSD